MPTSPSESRLTPTQWLICVIAVIGFAFDIYEILMLPLIVRPALLELTGAAPGSPEFQMWVGRLFYIPAFAGGIFGLLGGYLTDRLGRRRVLTYSILIYAVAAFLSGFSTSIQMLLVLRCFVFIGVCVEFVAAIAWLAELFPEPKRREKSARLHAGVLVARRPAGGVCQRPCGQATRRRCRRSDAFGIEGITDPHAAWRYTLMSGVIPAIPLILIRPFLPESPSWQQKKAAGTLKRPSIAALFAPELRRTTIVTTVMFAMSYGAAFGAIQQIPQIVPGLPEVRQMVQGLPPPQARLDRASALHRTSRRCRRSADSSAASPWRFSRSSIVSRQRLIRMFQIPGLIVMPIVFGWLATTSASAGCTSGIFSPGCCTVGAIQLLGELPAASLSGPPSRHR